MEGWKDGRIEREGRWNTGADITRVRSIGYFSTDRNWAGQSDREDCELMISCMLWGYLGSEMTRFHLR
jgi:hypothetical protein